MRALPATFFGRNRRVATGLGIAGAIIIALNLYSTGKYYFSEPAAAPVCYGDELLAGKGVISPRGQHLPYQRPP